MLLSLRLSDPCPQAHRQMEGSVPHLLLQPLPPVSGRLGSLVGAGDQQLPVFWCWARSRLRQPSFSTSPGLGFEKQSRPFVLWLFCVFCLGHVKIFFLRFFSFFFLVVLTLFQVIFVDVKCVYDMYMVLFNPFWVWVFFFRGN